MANFTLKVEDKLGLVIRANEYIRKQGYQTLVPLLIGDSGVGKSTRIVRMFNGEARILILSQLLPEDIGGLPRVEMDKGITKFYLPEWVENKVIFFDEIDKATKAKIAPILSIISERMLHGYDLSDRIIIIGGQPSILSYLDDPNNDTWAFSQRCVIIPVLSEEAYIYVNNKFGWDLKLISPRDKELIEFKMKNVPSPRVLEYIGNFISYLLYGGEKMVETEKMEDKVNKVAGIVSEIFYYYDLPFEALVRQLISKYETVSHEEKIVAINEKVKMGPAEALLVIPHAAVELDAVSFFAVFTALFEVISQDEKQRVMEEIYQAVAAAGEFTKSEVVDVARAFLISVAYLIEDQRDKDELFKRIKASFPRTLKKFNEKYEEIKKSWAGK
jgi:hypothetical protein